MYIIICHSMRMWLLFLLVCMYITRLPLYEYVVVVLTCIHVHVYNSFAILRVCGCSSYLYTCIYHMTSRPGVK